ncbi:hypothetical protein EDB83DRAFT_2550589, partial [Lactarius deliciosus]
ALAFCTLGESPFASLAPPSSRAYATSLSPVPSSSRLRSVPALVPPSAHRLVRRLHIVIALSALSVCRLLTVCVLSAHRLSAHTPPPCLGSCAALPLSASDLVPSTLWPLPPVVARSPSPFPLRSPSPSRSLSLLPRRPPPPPAVYPALANTLSLSRLSPCTSPRGRLSTGAHHSAHLLRALEGPKSPVFGLFGLGPSCGSAAISAISS